MKPDVIKAGLKKLRSQSNFTIVLAALQEICADEIKKGSEKEQSWKHISELLGGCIIQSGEQKL